MKKCEEASWMRGETQETETSPVAYNTALRIIMTWMTENPHQHEDVNNHYI